MKRFGNICIAPQLSVDALQFFISKLCPVCNVNFTFLQIMECSIGVELGDPCNKNNYTNRSNTKPFPDELKPEIALRTGVSTDKLESVCDHHKLKYYDYYSVSMKKCCNILQVHKKSVAKNLATITMEQHYMFPKLIPGNKICYKCLKKLPGSDKSSDGASIHGIAKDKLYSPPRENLSILNESLEAVELSPIKVKLSDDQMKRKVEKRVMPLRRNLSD